MVTTADVTTWAYTEFLIVSRHNQFDQSRSIIEIFNQINVKINTFDIEDCHRMGKLKKQLLSALLIERTVRQLWKKS